MMHSNFEDDLQQVLHPIRSNRPGTMSLQDELDYHLILSKGVMSLKHTEKNIDGSVWWTHPEKTLCLRFSRSCQEFVNFVHHAEELDKIKTALLQEALPWQLERGYALLPPSQYRQAIEHIRPVQPHSSWVFCSGIDAMMITEAVKQHCRKRIHVRSIIEVGEL
jgi:hypothetical protein